MEQNPRNFGSTWHYKNKHKGQLKTAKCFHILCTWKCLPHYKYMIKWKYVIHFLQKAKISTIRQNIKALRLSQHGAFECMNRNSKGVTERRALKGGQCNKHTDHSNECLLVYLLKDTPVPNKLMFLKALCSCLQYQKLRQGENLTADSRKSH